MLAAEVLHTIQLLNRFDDFSRSLDAANTPYAEELEHIREIFDHPNLGWLRKEKGQKSLSFFKLMKYDQLLRGGMHEEMKMMTSFLFNLDVYIAVVAVARRRGFSYARALSSEALCFSVEELRHPALENATGNAISLNQDQNALFLIGANMAGKSTLMKSIGISIYLAHMGFPVAASNMEFSVKDGLYTSINVPDNLGMGYSHFYAEVLRVKKVAEEVAAGRNLMAIF